MLKFVEAISEKTLRSTVALTAARGRGKSAALGLSMAAAVAFGYSNIFVTSPSPENLKTLFEFIFKGFDALDYQVLTDTIDRHLIVLYSYPSSVNESVQTLTVAADWLVDWLCGVIFSCYWCTSISTRNI